MILLISLIPLYHLQRMITYLKTLIFKTSPMHIYTESFQLCVLGLDGTVIFLPQ